MKKRQTTSKIIVHCTATAEGKDFSCADIRRWHTAPKNRGGNGWSDIGYHYVIRLDGRVEPGRSRDLVGAHTAGENASSVGVCYVGGLAADGKTPKDTRTPAQKKALKGLIEQLKTIYPGAKVYGHRDFSSKACPCFDARKEYA